MSLNSKVVYIVHAIDTEGPLYESLSETFLRLEYIDMDEDDFFEVADKFRSPHLWKKDGLDYILRHKVR